MEEKGSAVGAWLHQLVLENCFMVWKNPPHIGVGDQNQRLITKFQNFMINSVVYSDSLELIQKFKIKFKQLILSL